MAHQVACQTPGCKSKNARLVLKTNWPDYSVTRLILCSPCRTKMGLAASVTGESRVNRYAIPNKTVL